MKYIKVMPDYASTGLWDENGMMLSLWDIPYSEYADKDTFAKILFNWISAWERVQDKSFENDDENTKLISEGMRVGSLLKGIVQEDIVVEFTYDGIEKTVCEPKPIWVKVGEYNPK